MRGNTALVPAIFAFSCGFLATRLFGGASLNRFSRAHQQANDAANGDEHSNRLHIPGILEVSSFQPSVGGRLPAIILRIEVWVSRENCILKTA
jgi:hypothetical protein